MNSQDKKRRNSLSQKYEEFIGTLHEEVSFSRYQLHEHDTQLVRRQWIRSVFAYIEGTLNFLSFRMIDEKTLRINLDPAEIMALMEEVPQIKRNGTISTSPRFLPLDSKTLFVFRSFIKAESMTSSPRIFNDCKGWQSFRKAINVRNRILHPRNIADCEISDDEKLTIETGVCWFDFSINFLFVCLHLSMDKILYEMLVENFRLSNIEDEDQEKIIKKTFRYKNKIDIKEIISRNAAQARSVGINPDDVFNEYSKFVVNS